jgi:hypothetical protein
MNASIRCVWREVACVLCGLVAFVSCHSDRVQPPGDRQDKAGQVEVRTLSDGKQVSVLAIVRDEGPPITVNITYVTDIPLAEHNRLQDEVRRLWSESFRKDAQAAGAAKAYLLAQESKPGAGVSLSERATAFVYEHDASGKWVEAGGFSRPSG